MDHYPIPEIRATIEQARSIIDERSNGIIVLVAASGKEPAYMDISGELCLDELEAALVVAVEIGQFGPRAKDYIEQNKILPYAWGSCDENSGRALSTEINPRYGISPAQAVAIRRELSSKELAMDGMAANKGGRVWLSACTSMVAIEAIIVELLDYCRRRDYEVTHIDTEE